MWLGKGEFATLEKWGKRKIVLQEARFTLGCFLHPLFT